MKKIILAAVMLFAIASFGQKPDKSYYFELATSGFITNYGETGVNVDFGMFSSNPKWFPSINVDIYEGRRPVDHWWTTAQIGLRMNVPLTTHFLLSAGPKWVTQGGEKYDGYNCLVFDGAASFIHKLVERDDGIMWLKLSAQYNNTPHQRVFFMAGLQFALR